MVLCLVLGLPCFRLVIHSMMGFDFETMVIFWALFADLYVVNHDLVDSLLEALLYELWFVLLIGLMVMHFFKLVLMIFGFFGIDIFVDIVPDFNVKFCVVIGSWCLPIYLISMVKLRLQNYRRSHYNEPI